jgi:hypothetical protein
MMTFTTPSNKLREVLATFRENLEPRQTEHFIYADMGETVRGKVKPIGIAVIYYRTEKCEQCGQPAMVANYPLQATMLFSDFALKDKQLMNMERMTTNLKVMNAMEGATRNETSKLPPETTLNDEGPECVYGCMKCLYQHEGNDISEL